MKFGIVAGPVYPTYDEMPTEEAFRWEMAMCEVARDHGLLVHAAYAQMVLGTLGDEPAVNLRAAYETYRALGAETMRRRTAHAMKAAGVDTPRNRRARSGELNETELKLSQLVHDGLTNREIANVLMVSPKTVETHRENIKHKLGLNSAQIKRKIWQHIYAS